MPKATATTKHPAFRRDIQTLRTLAILAVVIYHLWPNRLGGGFTGVDIFFVISGYLMTVSIMRRLKPLADHHTITPRAVGQLLTDFYAHRIKRLVPAALTALLGVLALAEFTGNLNVVITNAENALSAATFWQNWSLAQNSLNYLQQNNLIVATQHFWSLSLEEQFYLLWPLFLIVGTLITLNIVIMHKRDKIPGLILPVTLITMISLVYGVWLTANNATIAYYSTPARVWELMIGGIIALLPAIKSYDLKLLLPYLGFAIDLYAIFFVGSAGFPGWSALIPTIGTALIIWGGTDHYESKLSFDHLFRWRPIQWTGDISYSIYLWHFPLIILVPIIIRQDINGPFGQLIKFGIVALSFLIAWLSYKYVEQAARYVRWKTRYVYLAFAIITGLVVALSLYVLISAQHQTTINLNAIHHAVESSQTR